MTPDDSATHTPPPAACPAACRRHAALGPVVAGAGWLVAAVAALSVAAVPYDAGESVCGVWGCFPPLPAVAALHLLWGVALAAAVWGLRLARPALLRPVGIAVVLVAVAGAVHFVGRDVLNWLHYAGDESRHLWPRRVAYRLATLTDVPLLQAVLAGAACVALGRPRRRAAPSLPPEESQ